MSGTLVYTILGGFFGNLVLVLGISLLFSTLVLFHHYLENVSKVYTEAHWVHLHSLLKRVAGKRSVPGAALLSTKTGIPLLLISSRQVHGWRLERQSPESRTNPARRRLAIKPPELSKKLLTSLNISHTVNIGWQEDSCNLLYDVYLYQLTNQFDTKNQYQQIWFNKPFPSIIGKAKAVIIMPKPWNGTITWTLNKGFLIYLIVDF